MNKHVLLIISVILFVPFLVEARAVNRLRCGGIKNCEPMSCAWNNCEISACGLPFCNGAPYCGPFPRPLPGQYDSFSDNTKIAFWNIPPCAPRNDSKERGYLYKGMWWDISGVRYWAIRNSTNNTVSVEALEGGEYKDIPAGDVVNIGRGESYAFRVQAPARRFELFQNDAHFIEIFVNLRGDLDYRAEIPVTAAKTATNQRTNGDLIMPKF